MSDLDAHRQELRAWLEENCPPEMREPVRDEDDVCWGGREVKFKNEAQRQWLPEFGNRKIRPTPTISIPRDVKPVDVPLDPALAIHKRFGQLITQKTD